MKPGKVETTDPAEHDGHDRDRDPGPDRHPQEEAVAPTIGNDNAAKPIPRQRRCA